jgi:hypothetical protein
MDTHRLVKMANDIASFFNSEPDHQVALEGVAGHINASGIRACGARS